MDFSLGDRAEFFRDEVRNFLAEHLTTEVVERMHSTGTFDDKDFNVALAEAGLLAGAVPGYGDRDPIELYILFNHVFNVFPVLSVPKQIETPKGTQGRLQRIQ